MKKIEPKIEPKYELIHNYGDYLTNYLRENDIIDKNKKLYDVVIDFETLKIIIDLIPMLMVTHLQVSGTSYSYEIVDMVQNRMIAFYTNKVRPYNDKYYVIKWSHKGDIYLEVFNNKQLRTEYYTNARFNTCGYQGCDLEVISRRDLIHYVSVGYNAQYHFNQ